MPVETDTERAAMLSDWGVVARFRPAAGGQTDLTVIWDDPFVRSEGEFAAAASRIYWVTALESEVDGINGGNQGDVVEYPVGGQQYTVKWDQRRQGIIDLALDMVK